METLTTGSNWVAISWYLDELCRNFLSSHCRYRVFFCTHKKKNMSPVFDCFCWDNKNFEWNAAHIYLHQMLLLPACSIRPVRPSGIKTQVNKAPKATVMMIAGRKGISEGANWGKVTKLESGWCGALVPKIPGIVGRSWSIPMATLRHPETSASHTRNSWCVDPRLQV